MQQPDSRSQLQLQRRGGVGHLIDTYGSYLIIFDHRRGRQRSTYSAIRSQSHASCVAVVLLSRDLTPMPTRQHARRGGICSNHMLKSLQSSRYVSIRALARGLPRRYPTDTSHTPLQPYLLSSPPFSFYIDVMSIPYSQSTVSSESRSLRENGHGTQPSSIGQVS